MYPGLVLKVFWDDANAPSIQVPLWNFLVRSGGETIDYQSAPMQINHYCYMSYLPMPFSKRARFVLANDGERSIRVPLPTGWITRRAVVLRPRKAVSTAGWSRSNPTREAMHQILDVTGKGQYVGNFLQFNTTYEGWWGEGDTIFDVDGHNTLIVREPRTNMVRRGHLSTHTHICTAGISRWRKGKIVCTVGLANPVRFQKSLKVAIQDQRNQNGQIPSSDDITSVAFWYQAGPTSGASAAPLQRTALAPSRGAKYQRSK